MMIKFLTIFLLAITKLNASGINAFRVISQKNFSLNNEYHEIVKDGFTSKQNKAGHNTEQDFNVNTNITILGKLGASGNEEAKNISSVDIQFIPIQNFTRNKVQKKVKEIFVIDKDYHEEIHNVEEEHKEEDFDVNTVDLDKLASENEETKNISSVDIKFTPIQTIFNFTKNKDEKKIKEIFVIDEDDHEEIDDEEEEHEEQDFDENTVDLDKLASENEDPKNISSVDKKFIPIETTFNFTINKDQKKVKEILVVDEDYYEEVDDVSTFHLDKLGCHIDIRNLPQRTPLLRDPITKNVLYPNEHNSSVISLRSGEEFEIDCPGSSILIEGQALREITQAVCVHENLVRILGHLVPFDDVLCQRRVKSVAKYNGKRCYGNKGKEIEVGFKYTDDHFNILMTSCFGKNDREVFYTKFRLHHRIGSQNTGGTRPAWTEGSFYQLEDRLNNIYKIAAQRVQINRQLGLSDSDPEYIKPQGNTHFLAKGHLVARSDMFYYGEQDATFWYINSVPQWQTFNGFNWAYFERAVRNMAYSRKLDLEIITGAHGHATLPHAITKKEVKLSLYVDESDGGKYIPVPEIFYKIIYSNQTKTGVVVIGINNPYEPERSNYYCRDVIHKLTWLNFDVKRRDRGYLYACHIEDFNRFIKKLPSAQYHVNGLLS